MSWYDSTDERGLNVLVGHKIRAVSMSEETLQFLAETPNHEAVVFEFKVEGECCSFSYFHDFVGVMKLLENGPVTHTGSIALNPDSFDDPEEDYVQCYGFEIVTEHPTWGEQTSVFSFRNSSNGYYGGWMEFVGSFPPHRLSTEHILRSVKI